MNSKPKYTFGRCRTLWAVYEMSYNGDSASGTKVDEFYNREDALNKMYELNGWQRKKQAI